ncbi:DUF3263 domain-containing protein [Agreia sp. COWG]|uniref:DUF3263 domain-containing protein n=1 Tax=Agreia sp. COWG TaxID=2773266 RepID=UPI001AF453D3|nr:DUF3263 domain-containing protein [Agreia sp. COWG]CAD6003607.1 conserved protein of unknown function [Agreia sp. COWG]
MDAAEHPADDNDQQVSPSSLDSRDVAILSFERMWWKHAGVKEQAIRNEFGMSAARYYQVLGRLMESPLALAHDPMLIKRLHRVRDARTAARQSRFTSLDD